MSAWLDGEGRLFNPRPRVSAIPIAEGHECIVVDDALADPERLRQWAANQRFVPPSGYPYPGRVSEAPADLAGRVADFFAQHARGRLGARRTQDIAVRFSVIHTPPEALQPVQWLCHRDRLAEQGSDTLFAAGVLYLFHDEALGGTSFYRPRQPMDRIDRLVADSQQLAPSDFTSRYGLQPGYMAGDNAWFERTARVGPAWNRFVFYDGSLFHSADVVEPSRMLSDPLRGRLTLNCFVTCRRRLG